MKVKLSNVRAAFLVVFEPEKFQGTGELAYSGQLILDPTEHAAQIVELNKAIKALAVEKWGAKGEAMLAEMRKKDNVCYHPKAYTNASGEVYDGFEGMHYVSFRNSGKNGAPPTRVTILDRDKTPLTAADGRPYSGCYVNVSLELWAQDNNYGKRINASLGGIQFVKHGDAFSGGAPTSPDEFDDLGVPEEADEALG